MIYLSVNQQKGQWAVFWIALLILFNPIAPVGLKKDTWVVLDIISGIAVAGSKIKVVRSEIAPESARAGSTEIRCPKCQGAMRLALGRFGEFLYCLNYRGCRGLRQVPGSPVKVVNSEIIKPREAGSKAERKECPECGADLLLNISSFGEFWGCSEYPHCEFITRMNNWPLDLYLSSKRKAGVRNSGPKRTKTSKQTKNKKSSGAIVENNSPQSTFRRSNSLSLQIHRRFSREEIFSSLGMFYQSQKTRHLNVGLSPKTSDGGYLIFVTLDKEELDPAFDYYDDIFTDCFLWTTRRLKSFGEQYSDLEDPNTRVSLLIRKRKAELFLYAGELKYERHEEFRDSATDKLQRQYVWKLKQSLPEHLLEELSFGLLGHQSKRPNLSGDMVTADPVHSSLDELKRAYRYALGISESAVNPVHHHCRLALGEFLRSKGISYQLESDSIDITFNFRKRFFVGKIKTTGTAIPSSHAFRLALGQLLDDGHYYPADSDRVLFLDFKLGESEQKIASRLGIATVCMTKGRFKLMNHGRGDWLKDLFN